MRLIRTTTFAALLGAASAPALAQDAFTYQGSLQSAGQPYTGTADYLFSLWDAPAGGNQIGATVAVDGLDIDSGLFSTEVDFGAESHGPGRYLQIAVRTPAWDGNGSEPAFFPFPERTTLTASPYSLSTRGIVVDAQNRVGIGTDTPEAALDVAAKIRINGTGSFAALELDSGVEDFLITARSNIMGIEHNGQRLASFKDDGVYLASVDVLGSIHAYGGPIGPNNENDRGLTFHQDRGTGLTSMNPGELSLFSRGVETFTFTDTAIEFPDGSQLTSAATLPFTITRSVPSFPVPGNGQYTHTLGTGDQRIRPGMTVIVTPPYTLWDFHTIAFARVISTGNIEWRIVSIHGGDRTYGAANWTFTVIP